MSDNGYEPLKLKADIVTMSNDKPGHSYLPGIKTEPFVVKRPGEYEISNIFITGHATNKKGEPRNTIFVIEINGLFVAHLGNINRPPTQTEVETLGTVNVLLVPVGGGSALNASQAVETIRKIQPHFAIPMHYSVARTLPELDPLSKFLKDLRDEEAIAINCHMGFSRGVDSTISIGESFRYSPLAWIVHVADEAAVFMLDRGTSDV